MHAHYTGAPCVRREGRRGGVLLPSLKDHTSSGPCCALLQTSGFGTQWSTFFPVPELISLTQTHSGALHKPVLSSSAGTNLAPP